MNELIYMLLISFLIASSILMIGFDEMGKFSYQSKEEKIFNELEDINQKINFLDKVSIGSFDHKEIIIPNGFKVIIYKNGTADIISNREVKSFNFDKKFTCLTSDGYACRNNLTLEEGDYKLLLYHGDKFESTYTICFE